MDDPKLQRFVLRERQKVKMQEHLNELTERCVTADDRLVDVNMHVSLVFAAHIFFLSSLNDLMEFDHKHVIG